MAVTLALALRDRVWELGERWTRLGFSLSPALGLALGHATIGRIGSDRRWQYAPVGPAPLLAERLAESRHRRPDPRLRSVSKRPWKRSRSRPPCPSAASTTPVRAFDLVGT